MRNKIVLMTLALFLVTGAPVAAQGFGLGAHAGVSLPTGDYADAADLGFLGGVDLWFPLTMVAPGLTWYTSADAIAHSADESFTAEGGFFYIPLMTGLRFNVPVGPVAAFATGQVGLLLTQGPDIEFGVGDTDSELGTSFGYTIGAGLQVTPNIYAGVKYWPLGTRTFEYEGDATLDREVSFLDIYIGFGAQ